MQTQQEILKIIDTEADKHDELKSLQSNTSKVAFWKFVKEAISFAMLTLEKLFQAHLKEVESLIKRTEPGTDHWYKGLVLKYQDGDTVQVINNLTVYPTADENKRIVKRVSISSLPEGGFRIKVAKQGGSGLEPLNEEELNRFKVYVSRVKLPGVPIQIVSLPASLLGITATITIDALLYKENGTRISDNKRPLREAIDQYLQNFPFDEKFYLSKLIDNIQKVEGVIDVNITKAETGNVEIKGGKIDEVPAGYLFLDNSKSNISYVLD